MQRDKFSCVLIKILSLLRNANGTDVVLTVHLNFMKPMRFVCTGNLAKCTLTHLPFHG